MFPKLFEVPLLGDIPTSWPVFIGLVLGLLAVVSVGAQKVEKAQAAGKPRIGGQLLVYLPVAAFVTAFLTFVQTPFGKMPINSYGFSIMVGFLLASWIAVRRAKALGLKSDFILDVGIIAMIFGIIGAKINYLLQYGSGDKGFGKSVFGDLGLNWIGAFFGLIPLAFWWWRTKDDPQKIKLYSWQTAVLFVLTLLFALVGTRAVYLWEYRNEYNWTVIKNWQMGFVLYGGLIAGVAAGALYVKMRGHSIAQVADLAAAPMMLALAFGRLGCFLNGCCYGQVGSAFTCISFPPDSPAFSEQRNAGKVSLGDKGSLPVHPTQLYEAAAAVAFFFILSWFWRKKRKAQGEVFLIMVMLYGAWRFVIEFARGDQRPVWIGTLSYSQVVSLVAFIGAAIWLFLLRNRPQPAAVPPPPPPAPSGAPGP